MITGMQSCPCPEECEGYLRETAPELPVWRVGKEQQVCKGTTYIKGTFPECIFDPVWEKFPGISSLERETCINAFRAAYEKREEGNEFYMKGYTLSPTIFYVKNDRIYPVGGKESLRIFLPEYLRRSIKGRGEGGNGGSHTQAGT